MSDLYLQVMTALGAVLGLIFLLAFLLRKKQRRNEMMRVIAYHPLGTRKGITAMKVGEEILLLGVTPADIKLLRRYNASDFESEEIRDISKKVMSLRRLKEGLGEDR
ncbi:MAG: FliO/MopB family protein [Thermodesulfovibrionales bacterium]